MTQEIIARVNKVDIVSAVTDGQQLIPIRPICQAIGIAYQPQVDKVKTHPTFASTVTLGVSVASDGRNREQVCLPAEMILLWLGTINPDNVSEDARPTIIRYQKECAHALWLYFVGASQKQKELNDVERRLLDEKAAALEEVAEHKRAMDEAKGKVKKADDALAALQLDRLNPQPTLFD